MATFVGVVTRKRKEKTNHASSAKQNILFFSATLAFIMMVVQDAMALLPATRTFYPTMRRNTDWRSATITQQQQKQRRRSTGPLSMSSATKTGGRLIESASDFSEAVLGSKEPRPVMVFWTAPWCGPCRLSIPVVKEVMKQFAGSIETVEVCTDDQPEVAADAGVVSIPTIQIYFNGGLKDTIIGCVAKSVLASAVDKVLEDISAEIGAAEDEDAQ